MSTFSRWRGWARSVWNGERLDSELDREIDDWVDELAARYDVGGAAPQEARPAGIGRNRWSGPSQGGVREARAGVLLDTLLLDFRYAWRSVWNKRTLTIVILATIAMGCGRQYRPLRRRACELAAAVAIA